MSANKTVATALKDAERELSKSDTPSLDAQILLCEALSWSRERLLTSKGDSLSNEDLDRFKRLITRRYNGEPVAYITGRREFWKHEFFVTPAVLIPRPETELIVERAVGEIETRGYRNPIVVDIGTGSGCIACSIALELQERNIRYEMYATDISKDALKVAEGNAEKLGVKNITFKMGDLFEPLGLLKGKIDVLLSNPPYVAEGDTLVSPECAFEPKGALYSGGKGLDTLQVLIERAREFLSPQGIALFEHGQGQEEELSFLAEKSGFKPQSLKDLASINRTLFLTR